MSLYDDLRGSLTFQSGRTYGTQQTQKEFQRRIDAAYAGAANEGRVLTGYRPLSYQYGGGRGGPRYVSVNVPIFGRDPAAAEADLRAEQARLAGIQQKQFEAQQADIAKQLKIIQGEKSAVAKMQEEYSQMLIKEAERRKQAEEDSRVALQTQTANAARAGRSGALQIQGAGTTPRIGGTQQFRRRALQQGTASPYKGLSTIQSGMVNV